MAESAHISEVALKELDPRLQKQVENAEKTLDKNPTYTIDVCMGILQRHPGCLDVRKILRRAQRRAKSVKTGGLTKFLGSVTSAPFAMKAGSQLKKDPAGVLESAERMITSNPGNTTAYKMLGQAAVSLEMWQTAVFVFEDIKSLEPSNVENRIALAEALIGAGRARDAIREGDSLLQEHPALEAAQDLVRRASVAESLERGKWEEQTDFRDKLADAEKSVELEQASRVANDEDVLLKLIERSKKKIEEEPENLNNYRDVINAYRQLDRHEDALSYVEAARQTDTGRADPNLERLAADLRLNIMRARAEALESKLAESPNDAGLQAELESAKAELHAFRLQNAREIVEKYPNDYAAKYELGILLLEEGDYDGAIQEFQLAQRNPNVRTKALLSLGRSYLRKEFYDMAVEQLSIAKKEIPLMNDLKKETIYELARAYENMGQAEEAIAEYKLIYQSDIGYRDVADKINTFYANKRKST